MTKEPDKSPVDCGDNSCLCAYPKGGMRTNGGCRCFKMIQPREDRYKAEKAVLFWRKRADYFKAFQEQTQEQLDKFLGVAGEQEIELLKLRAQVERMATSDAADVDATVQRMRTEQGQLRDELREERADREMAVHAEANLAKQVQELLAEVKRLKGEKDGNDG